MALNCVVQALAIAAYAARLAGARSGRVATAISLFNIFATSSRFAQMFYSPMLGALSDRATGASLGIYQWQLRSIVFAGGSPVNGAHPDINSLFAWPSSRASLELYHQLNALQNRV